MNPGNNHVHKIALWEEIWSLSLMAGWESVESDRKRSLVKLLQDVQQTCVGMASSSLQFVPKTVEQTCPQSTTCHSHTHGGYVYNNKQQ